MVEGGVSAKHAAALEGAEERLAGGCVGGLEGELAVACNAGGGELERGAALAAHAFDGVTPELGEVTDLVESVSVRWRAHA